MLHSAFEMQKVAFATSLTPLWTVTKVSIIISITLNYLIIFRTLSRGRPSSSFAILDRDMPCFLPKYGVSIRQTCVCVCARARARARVYVLHD